MLVYTSCSVFKKKQDNGAVVSETKVIESSEIPFAIVDEVPVYKVCEDLKTNNERKTCMSKNIAMHVNKNFNTNVAHSLGLSGKQRIIVIFKIDKEGNVVDVKARAPHPELEGEAKRVVQSLPQFIPGKHKGKTVVVPYSLPILFEIAAKSEEETLSELKERFKDADEVPFMALDKAPVAEGCEDFATESLGKSCFSGFISGYVNKNFNVKLASALGLIGKQRINVMFKIDKDGRATDARSRGPHPELELEAVRVINSLPQFTPGEMNGKEVIVNYSLPIIFEVVDETNKDKKN
jgi:hypothetical protein